jgi:adenylylsulfate reductase subunit A
MNSLGEEYESRYGLATWQRLHGTVEETRYGRAPCSLGTAGITADQEEQLYRAYLNMAPAQTLKWLESGGPSGRNVEIEGTEPYIVGGHTASGYWVDTKRETTVGRLFAAGDAAGGCPQKYATGAMAEAEIASSAVLDAIRDGRESGGWEIFKPAIQGLRSEIGRMLNAENAPFSAQQLEEAMQSAMDRDAGGISSGYRYDMRGLGRAAERLGELTGMSDRLGAANMKDVLRVFELKDRLLVARCLLAHMAARRETRWGSFSYNSDHPFRDDDNFSKYVNSRYVDGRFEMIFRDIVKDETYEHSY